MDNIFATILDRSVGEILSDIVVRPGARVERIVSTGQATPHDRPYCQDHDEWVLLLQGEAGLWLDGIGDYTLHPGDYLTIPAGCIHRVTWTAADPPTIWLAVHFS